jgi:hypothetical protein
MSLPGVAVGLTEGTARHGTALGHIDRTVVESRADRRTGRAFLPGVRSPTVPQVAEVVDTWWGECHAEDFVIRAAGWGQGHERLHVLLSSATLADENDLRCGQRSGDVTADVRRLLPCDLLR